MGLVANGPGMGRPVTHMDSGSSNTTLQFALGSKSKDHAVAETDVAMPIAKVACVAPTEDV